jgi:hypothetical protein
VNHHLNPLNMSGPEFEGLTHDEAFELKKQLRIRDRNRMIATRMRDRAQKRAAARSALALGVTVIGFVLYCFYIFR